MEKYLDYMANDKMSQLIELHQNTFKIHKKSLRKYVFHKLGY